MRPRTPAIARRAHCGCCRRCVTRKRQWAMGGPLRRLRSVLSDCARRRWRGTARVGGDRRASKYNALPLRLHRFIHPVFVVVVVDDERLSAQRSLTAAWEARMTVVTAKTVAIRAPQRPGQLPVGRPSWQRNWPPDTAIPPPVAPSHKRLPLSSRRRRRQNLAVNFYLHERPSIGGRPVERPHHRARCGGAELQAMASRRRTASTPLSSR